MSADKSRINHTRYGVLVSNGNKRFGHSVVLLVWENAVSMLSEIRATLTKKKNSIYFPQFTANCLRKKI